MTRLPSIVGSTLLLSAFAVFCVAQSAPPATRPTSIAGTWKWEAQGFGGQTETVLKLAQVGEKVTGTIGGVAGESLPIENGVFKEGKLTFKTVRDINGQKLTTTFAASLHADALTGKSETVMTREFSAKRSPD